MAHQFPDNDDYKRGLVDMLDVLASKRDDGSITNRYREGIDLRNTEWADTDKLVKLASDYREELAKKAKLDDAIKMLRDAGYHVHNPHHVPTIDAAKQYLESNGYRVNKPGDMAKPPTMSTDQMIDALSKSGFIVQRRGITKPGDETGGPADRRGGGSPMGSYD